MSNFAKQRQAMVEDQLKARGIKDDNILSAFREIPRERFIPSEYRSSSYGDHPIPIGSGQTISQPYIVALMTENLALGKNDTALEIGTGSGYQAAILAKICKMVYGVERFPHLAKRAEELLENLKIKNVNIKVGDGTLGWNEHAPYDAIVVTASAPEIPEPLIKELKDGGRLVIPIGSMGAQSLVKITKRKSKLTKESICGCVFVPLVGKFGWSSK